MERWSAASSSCWVQQLYLSRKRQSPCSPSLQGTSSCVGWWLASLSISSETRIWRLWTKCQSLLKTSFIKICNHQKHYLKRHNHFYSASIFRKRHSFMSSTSWIILIWSSSVRAVSHDCFNCSIDSSNFWLISRIKWILSRLVSSSILLKG